MLLAGSMGSESAGGSQYVMMMVDDFSSFEMSKCLKMKTSVETAAALESYITTYITPEQVSIRAVRTDLGGEFEGGFQRKLDQMRIQHQHTPPDVPKYNDVAERWIGLLHEKTIALLGDLVKLAAGLRKEKYWAEAWNYSTRHHAVSDVVQQMAQPSLEVIMEVPVAMPPTTQQPERTMKLAEGR